MFSRKVRQWEVIETGQQELHNDMFAEIITRPWTLCTFPVFNPRDTLRAPWPGHEGK